MKSIPRAVRKELKNRSNPKKREFYPKFFKAYKGGYGEGDKFLGTIVPETRKVATLFWKGISIPDLVTILNDPYHEVRLCGLFILEKNYKKVKEENEKKKWVSVYLDNLDLVNNWDLVDLSASHILGDYLKDKNRRILFELAKVDNLWRNRIAMISTQAFIRNDDFTETLKLAEHFVGHPHDLMHKAVGWMLREVGSRNLMVERDFLDRFYKIMPRTMLRYAIEKFPEKLRKKYLEGKIQQK
jgi:3-methyladenine DNA glycosylase AlkD